MKKSRRTQLISVALISIILLICIVSSSLPEGGDSVLSAPFNALLKPVERLVQKTSKRVTKYFGAVSENEKLQAELDAVRQENVSLRLELQKNISDLATYHQIKDSYKLKDIYQNTAIVASNILERPLNDDADMYRIDQGFTMGSAGDNVRYTVLDEQGNLFGKIHSSDRLTAKILPITHAGFACDAINVNDEGHHFRLRGDSAYGPHGFCIIDQIPKDAKIAVGDSVVTGGTGGLFPKGLVIGTVSELLPDDVEGERRALVQPNANFAATNIVFVLTGTSSEAVGATQE